MDESGWLNFWKDQRSSFDAVMRINTTFFALQIEKLFQLRPTDSVLDYGCGPGFLADYLTTKNISVTGADINASFIEQCRKNHPASLFFHITTDVRENRQLFDEKLKGKQFDFIILLSIVQYFKNVTEAENLVGMLLSYLKENGRIIIADVVDSHSSAFRDTVSLFLQCVKKGKIIAFCKFISYLLFSNYSKLSRRIKLLRFSEQSIGQISGNNLLNCKKVSGLTIHSSRTNYVLSKTGIER